MPINDLSCFAVLKYDIHVEIHIDYYNATTQNTFDI